MKTAAALLRALAGTLALAASTLQCSVLVTQPRACERNADCRAAFGLGSTCAVDTGLCAPPERLARCSRTFPENLFDDLEAQRSSIVLGTIYDYTAHRDSQLATELAVRQVNRSGGLGAQRFAVVHCDYAPNAGDARSDLEATELITRYLVDTLEAPVVIGPRGSARAVAAYRAMNALRMAGGPGAVLLSPSATSPELTGLEGATPPTDENPGFLWRTVPPDTLQAEAIARDMAMRMVRNVTVVFQEGAYGEGLSELFRARFSALAPSATITLRRFTSVMLGDVIATVGPTETEEVLFISSNISDVVGFVNGTAATPGLAAQYERKRLFLTDTAYNQMLIDMSTEAARSIFERTRGTRPASAEGTPLFNAFAADYMLEYRMAASASGFTAHSYDAGWLALYGVAWSQLVEGAVTPRGVARGLRRVSSGRALEVRPSSWMGVQDAFRMRQGIDVQGASGQLNYDPATEETTAPIEVWRLERGATPGAFTLARDYVLEPS